MSRSRRGLWWASLALSSVGWTLLVHLYTQTEPWLGMGFLLLAGVCGVLASRGDEEEVFARRPVTMVALLLATVGAALFASPGFRASLGMLVCGLLLGARAGGIGRRISRGLLAVGSMAVAQGTSIGLYLLLVAELHGSATLLSSLGVGLLRIFGRAVSIVGETLYVSSTFGPIAVLPSRDHFSLVTGVVILVGFLVLVFLSDGGQGWKRLRAALAGMALVVLYLVIRYVLVLLAVLEDGSPRLLWNPAMLCLSFLPLIPVLAHFSGLVLPQAGTGGMRRAYGSRRSTALGAACALLVTVAVLTFLFLIPAGSSKEGMILFDEAHGEWETTAEPMRTDVYGLATTYNYASLADWLSYYAPVGRLTEPIDEEALRKASVLVLKTPSLPYSAEEIRAIDDFVRDGGGLFVIGDHTNVFGTTTALNPVLTRFGLALNYDSTYQLETGSFTIYRPTEPTLDPIAQHVDRFDFLTSCTIRAPFLAYRTIADDRILSNQADYATRDFFPRERYNLQSLFGRFTQAAAVLHGTGRVVVFTDSTCFSNFSVFMDGYPDFLLGTFTFLSFENHRIPVRWLAGCVAALGIIGLGAITWGRRELGLVGILIGVLAGWALFSLGAQHLHARWYELPDPAEDIPSVYFDLGLSDIEIEPQPASSDLYDVSRQFDTLFVWTQRVQGIPQLVDDGSRGGTLPNRPIVIIDPVADLSDQALREIRRYVEEGGVLILADSCGRDASGTTLLLERLELALDGICGQERTLAESSVRTYPISPSLVLAVSQVGLGAGRVILISDSTAFSNLSLGGAFTLPSGIQEAIYSVWFDVVRDALGIGTDGQGAVLEPSG